ncbi:hypothetical protein LVD15_22655 [Fulvivirga maritima]|uniref:hypothetical protein n=1 Tax=Fulvivirga maritima TaxID=2904247 RepID=UPI001F2DE749|nr:hypothetical protein [Fulvivirga maritima]UII26075.1 hypothetical protein LVD15_22655 [Fulvivirga maritima]
MRIYTIVYITRLIVIQKMTEEFKYRPPIKYFFVGLGGLVLFSLFGLGVIKGEKIWFSIIVGLFSLMGLGMGISFLTIFFRKLNVGKLKLGTDFIEIPGRWKGRIKLNFNDIIDIGEFDTYDNVIEIESRQGIHLIERNWMKQNEFDIVKKRLREYWIKK